MHSVSAGLGRNNEYYYCYYYYNVASPWPLFFDLLIIHKPKRAAYQYIELLSSECAMLYYMLDAQLFLQSPR